MKIPSFQSERRRVLRGMGGVTLGLPWLEAFSAGSARAANPVYSVFVVGCNGVIQNLGSEPERFWPGATGTLTRAGMLAEESSRATATLSRFAERMLIVRGVNLPFSGGGACAHTWGDNQCLTAQTGTGDKDGAASSLAKGESVDNRIATALNSAGRGPLTLHAGFNDAGGKGYGNPGYVSYKASEQPNSPESSPFAAYTRMAGLGSTDSVLAQKIAARKLSVNDLVRKQLRGLMANAQLGADDKKRLDQHLQSVRDLEIKLTGELSAATVDRMKKLEIPGSGGRAAYHSDEDREETVRLHMDVIALAFRSDYTRVATLKIGDNNDGIKYTVNGTTLPSFHMISHRVLSDGGSGPPIANAVELHADIDRRAMGHFGYLNDRLAETDVPGGKLLDQCLSLWTNQVGNGNHDLRNIPIVIVGRAGGSLKTGRFVDLGGIKNNRLWNTVLTAVGVRGAGGAPIENFGDPTLQPGVISDLLL
jgi:Protein of unknown function (DUF1552)